MVLLFWLRHENYVNSHLGETMLTNLPNPSMLSALSGPAKVIAPIRAAYASSLLPILFVTSSLVAFMPAAYAQSGVTEWGVPDLQGNWKNLDPDRPAPAAEALPPVGNYDLFWTDRGMFLPTIDGEFRTSAIIDPANGRVPERVAGFNERMAALAVGKPDRNDGPEGRSLGERCLVAFGNSSGPVMSPVMYNSHMQIVQSPGYVTIVVEMVHDARIIKISDDRSPAAPVLDKWMGDSIGRWEGDTLIVETKHV